MNALLTPIAVTRRETTTTEVARRMLEYLLAGQFDPGHRLPSERKLAEELRVGRSVVREALKSLTLLGIVEVRQGDGTFLRSTESDLLPHSIEWGLMLGTRRTRDLVEARRYLESILAGLAAERRDAAAIADLERELATMQAAGSDVEAFINADLAFHLRIAEAANNETLHQIMVSIRTLLQVWISKTVHKTTNLDMIAAEHSGIYQAIVASDAARAREAMDDHMRRAFERLEDTIAADAASVAAEAPAPAPAS